MMKKLIKNLLPPIVAYFLKSLLTHGYGWLGDYSSWEKAKSDSFGYNSEQIFKKVSSSIMRVKSGEKAYERDSVVFDQIHYSWPLLSCLMWIAALNKGTLNLVDFGGALGSSYFQNRKFIRDLNITWNVVEQPQFVEFGKKNLEDDSLFFFNTIEECYSKKKPDTVLLSSVLPYLEKPYELLDTIAALDFEWLIIDRTPIIESDNDRLTVQKVLPEIYDASYPCWIFSQTKLLRYINKHFRLIEQFIALAGDVPMKNPRGQFTDRGFLMQRIQSATKT